MRFFASFPWISFPPGPEYSIKTVSNFFENSRRYLQVKGHHRYQRDTGGKFFHQFPLCCWYQWQIYHRSQWYRRQICYRYQWRRWQIATGINDTGGKFATGVNNTGVENELENFFFIYMLTLLPKGVQKKQEKNFWWKIFFHLHLELRISLRIFEKIRNSPNGIIRGLGETDSWKKIQKEKISWHCPFNIGAQVSRSHPVGVNMSA